MKTQAVCRIASIKQLDGTISQLDTLAWHIGPNPGEDRNSLSAMPPPASPAEQVGEVIVKPCTHSLWRFSCSRARRDGV